MYVCMYVFVKKFGVHGKGTLMQVSWDNLDVLSQIFSL